MAYGLDVEAVYYTDNALVDMGIIDKYTIDIDLADEKNFEIKTANYTLPIGGFWYIPDTEYGGVIRGKRTLSSEEEAIYTGSSWRGILHNHILNVSDKQDVRYLQGDITELVNELLQECGLESLFVCNEPFINSDINRTVDLLTVPRGTTLYEAIWQAARSINFNYIFEFSNKMVRLTPILSEDYSDYMVYSSIGALSFDMSDETGAVNHYIMTSVSDTNKKRTIHLFTDGDGTVMPYANVDDPVQDSDYILDTSQQLLFGVDEVAEYEEVQERVVENYKLLETAPKNWKRDFGNYYFRDVEDEAETFEPYEATEENTYTALSSKPSDWNRNYSSYFDRQLNDKGEYEYVAVSATSTKDLANKKKVKSIPKDWKTDYGQYYYEYESGTGTEYETYSGVSKNKYTLLTKKPSDWSANWGSYYRRVVEHTKQVNGKKQKYYVDVAKNQKGSYKTVSSISEKEPAFTKNRYYKRSSYSVTPEFLKNKTYIIPNKEVAPTFVANAYYKQKTSWMPPVFVKGNVFEKVLDHYADMVVDALAYLETQVRSKQQKVTMDNFIVNIGDTVGGRDEFTGETIVAEISNINVEITNGLIEAEYVIGG